MAQIEELASQLSYSDIAARVAVASEQKSEAAAELSLMKDVLEYKLSHETEGVVVTPRVHAASGQTINTSRLDVDGYRAELRETLKSNFDLNGLIESLQILITQTIAEGDTQVSRRTVLREILQLVESKKSYTRSTTVGISRRT